MGDDFPWGCGVPCVDVPEEEPEFFHVPGRHLCGVEPLAAEALDGIAGFHS